ncbi:site-specific integrase [Sabulicella glaciei]|uniref:Site-specific integrase n=1 Tax=Sabulicella glaciei TaxID=2984948 RepID=A0ABT3NZX8_9PROT|nr:site-specific integrase [Roseococcus sp. MDT2-1-1]MCW8087650.1 site-specific integrase [Roseococcus sp. MDT2-1-1]
MRSISPETLADLLAEYRDDLVQRLAVQRVRAGGGSDARTSTVVGTLSPTQTRALLDGLMGAEPGDTLGRGTTALLAEAAAPHSDQLVRTQSLSLREARAQRSLGRAAVFQAAVHGLDMELARDDLAGFLDRRGIALTPDKRLLAEEGALKTQAWAHREMANRERAPATEPWQDPVLRISISLKHADSPVDKASPLVVPPTLPPAVDRAATNPSVAPAPVSGAVATPTPTGAGEKTEAPLVSVLAQRWIDEGRSGDPRAAKNAKVRVSTVSDRILARRMFLDLIGDMPAQALVPEVADRFVAVLGRLPARHGKGEYKNLTPRQAIEYADSMDLRACATGDEDAPTVPRLSLATVNRYLSALAPALDGNAPLDRHGRTALVAARYTKAQVEAEPTFVRKQLDDDQLHRIFHGPLFLGHDGSRDRGKPGPYLVRDGMYWTPLLALYGGACLEEVLQLRPKDIVRRDGVALMCIGADGAKVKGLNRRRDVPLHDALIRLGFLDWVEEARRNGQARLFPEVRRGGSDGRFGHAETQRHTAYRRAVGITGRGADIHGLRHTFSNRLFRTGVNQAAIADLMGHARTGITAATYGGDFMETDLATVVNRISFPAVDLNRLIEAAGSLRASQPPRRLRGKPRSIRAPGAET